MNHFLKFLPILFVVASCFSTVADDATAPKLPAKKKFYLYLLMGQSNMAGRGNIEAEDTTPHPRVLLFASNQWEVAIEPVTRDRKPGSLGVGPGLAFGKAMADKYSEATVGLLPCAMGGTPLSRWQKGGDLYSNAVRRAKAAMKSGTLKGMLWHQGESDSKRGTADTYGERLDQMIRDLRADLDLPELPFVAGQLGEFLLTRKTNNVPEARIVNDAIAKLPERVPRTAFVSSKGLTHKGDQLHFDSASQRELGKRFAAEIIRLK